LNLGPGGGHVSSRWFLCVPQWGEACGSLNATSLT
jgi:hypothetical protein